MIMSVCNIPFVTSGKQKHGFVSNFVWMFLGWTPSKLVESGFCPYLTGIISNIVHFLPILRFKKIKTSYSLKIEV